MRSDPRHHPPWINYLWWCFIRFFKLTGEDGSIFNPAAMMLCRVRPRLHWPFAGGPARSDLASVAVSALHARHAFQTTRCISVSAQLDRDKNGRERVVVLGSGWGGYTLAQSLSPSRFQVIIVSPRTYFVFTPLLASTSVGTLEFRTALEPVRSRRSNASFFQGWADGVDFRRKRILVEEGVVNPRQSRAPTTAPSGMMETSNDPELRQELVKKGELFSLDYDKLVISVGSYTQTFGIPGVKENANFLKDVGDARRIRKRVLECFEAAALPTASDSIRRQVLKFAIVGGGPTGVEFSAELHDLITEDMKKIYPELMQFVGIDVYDVAPQVLSMFDERLSKYAMESFRREGIGIKTSRTIKGLERGLPTNEPDMTGHGLTLKVEEDGDLGVGMVVWSTGLMQNPFVKQMAEGNHAVRAGDVGWEVDRPGVAREVGKWNVDTNPKTGSIMTNEKLQVLIHPTERSVDDTDESKTSLQDVFAIGDCATMRGTTYPATAQVASQKAVWLAKRFNKNDLQSNDFTYRDLGTMAYIGNWRAILQGGGDVGNVSGRMAWIIWRGAYLTKTVSWRNKVLIPMYWFLNWVFGRDMSRF